MEDDDPTYIDPARSARGLAWGCLMTPLSLALVALVAWAILLSIGWARG